MQAACGTPAVRETPTAASVDGGAVEDASARPAAAEVRVAGRLLVARPSVTADGYGVEVTIPVGGARVALEQGAARETELAHTYTDADGSFELVGRGAGELSWSARAEADPELYPFSVRDCPSLDCDGGGQVHRYSGASFVAGSGVQLDPVVLPASGELSGAFSIFNTLTIGMAFVDEQFGVRLAQAVHFRRDEPTACPGTCAVVSRRALLVSGTADDRDEYDDSVLLHELAHLLEAELWGADSPGGSHGSTPVDPRLAWGEGQALFMSAAMRRDPVYVDAGAARVFAVDLSSTRATADPDGGLQQDVSEYLVADLLWQLAFVEGTAETGLEAVVDVLTGYLGSSDRADRGVQGVDLVDFLDGWVCLGHGDSATLATRVLDRYGFPYDGTETGCPMP